MKPDSSNLKWMSSLRAFGLVLVLTYHFVPAALPAGFLGVDVFFTFSGYLITALLIKEFDRSGKISLIRFYRKRVRRLFPAVLFMVVTMLPLSLVISPDFRVGIGRQAAAVIGWVTNYYEILTGQSYENQLLPHMFVHTWTLSVEMQFYILWGAVIFVVMLICRRRYHMQDEISSSDDSGFMVNNSTGGEADSAIVRRSPAKGIIFVLAIIIGILSFTNMQILFVPAGDSSFAYFATTSHIFPLMIGSGVAVIAGFGSNLFIKKLESVKRPLLAILIAAFFAVIVALSLTLSFEAAYTYRFGILAVSVLAGFIIILFRALQSSMRKPEPMVIKIIADRSFSMYLFHWPLYIIISQLVSSTAVSVIIATILTFVFGDISFRFVEKPFRLGSGEADNAQSKKARFVALPKQVRMAAVGLVFVLCVGMVSFSWHALRTAPFQTGIQQDYEHEALLLSVLNLEDANKAMLNMDFDPVAELDVTGALPEKPSEKANRLENERQEAEKQKLDAIRASLDSPYGTVTVIGDSVCLGAASVVRSYIGGGYFDAAVSRRMSAGVGIIESLKSSGLLGEYVVIALATNTHESSFKPIDQVISAIGTGHRIIFVTGHGKDYMQPFNDILRGIAANTPYITVADWSMSISQRPDLLAADGIHAGSSESKAIYAQCITDALREAAKGGVS